MKKQTYCASLILLSSTSIHAAYDVQKGDNLNIILNRFIDNGVGPSKTALYQEILKYNQFIKNPDLIYPGQKIVLPDLMDMVYEVKAGDTFNGIVKKHKSLAPHLTLWTQTKKTAALNPHIKDLNVLEIGDKLLLGKTYSSPVAKEFAFYKIKKGDSFPKILNRFYSGVDITQALKYVKKLNPKITDMNVLEPDQVVKLPARVNGENLIDKYVDRVVASVKRIQPRYYYPDELGYEIKKMNSDNAQMYLEHFQKLTKTDSPEKWKSIINDVVAVSNSEQHGNIERTFYLYSIDIEEDSSVKRVRGELKAFLKIWKDAREKRFNI